MSDANFNRLMLLAEQAWIFVCAVAVQVSVAKTVDWDEILRAVLTVMTIGGGRAAFSGGKRHRYKKPTDKGGE